MPSQDNRLTGTRRLAILALLLSLALMIGVVERMIPFQPPVPGVRLGLPNVVILFALYLFSFRDCFLLVLMKCVLTVLFAGSFPSFFYSLTGSLLSLLGMYLMIRLLGDTISPVGVSVTGAVLHNTGQLLAASLLMGTLFTMAWLPVLMVSGVITGALTGTAVGMLRRLPVDLVISGRNGKR